MYDPLGATPPPGVAHTQHTHPLSHTHTHTKNMRTHTHCFYLSHTQTLRQMRTPHHSRTPTHTDTHTHTQTHGFCSQVTNQLFIPPPHRMVFYICKSFCFWEKEL